MAESSVHSATVNPHESDAEPEIVLSVFWFGSKLGCAYYEGVSYQLHLMMDIVETAPQFNILQRVVNQVNPKLIITSAKQDDRLLHLLDEIDKRETSVTETATASKKLKLLPSKFFDLQRSKRRILSIQMPIMNKMQSEVDRIVYLSSLINFDYLSLVRALGGLLRFLDENKIEFQLEAGGKPINILAIQSFSLDKLLLIDENTMNALQIFHKERHPSVYKGGSGTKEGLSLYGIFNNCKSAQGSKTLRLMMLRPTYDVYILCQRQKAIQFFVQGNNLEIMTNLKNCLKNIKNIEYILGKMNKAQGSYKDWQSLYKTVYNAILIGDICKTLPQNINIFEKINNTFTDDLFHVATIISKIVDFEESAIQNRFTVKTGVDEDLDRKKMTYNNLPELMSSVAEEEFQKLHVGVSECNVTYLPRLGYLICIKQTEAMKATGNYELPGMQFMFTFNDLAYYRNNRTTELATVLGDAQYEITDHEAMIMLHIQEAVLEKSAVLIDVLHNLSELDCLIALAIAAKNHNLVRPKLTEANSLNITKGRHILQELCISAFVPNDTLFGETEGRIQFLTGPNASGKSIYLKQVALIAYMAHIGSYVPAQDAEICMLHSILSRVHTLESVSIGLSTFALDLNQMSLAMRNATSRSLVVVDEFGKGTHSLDGTALLAACLRYWLNQNHSSPLVLLATHFHDITKWLHNSANLAVLTMEIMQEQSTMAYLYQVTRGYCNNSFAYQVATLAGFPEAVVQRAKHVTEATCKNEQIARQTSKSENMNRCDEITTQFLKANQQADDRANFLLSL